MIANFKVIGLTRLGIKPDSATSEADDAITTRTRAATRRGGAEPPLKKCRSPYKKLVTITHDTGEVI